MFIVIFFFLNFSDDVCVLSAIGTAAIINPQFTMSENKPPSAGILTVTSKDADRDILKDFMDDNSQRTSDSDTDTVIAQVPTGCFLCHIPYSKLTLPVNGKMKKCSICK